LALSDYLAMGPPMNDGRVAACRGYCLCRLQQHLAATLEFEAAIAAGFAPAEVYNDLGYSHFLAGQYESAKAPLDRALALAPALQAARYNRALLHLQRAVCGSGAAARDGLADIERAAAGPGAADLYTHAASLAALAGQPETALRYLRRAVDHGQDP